MGTPIGHVDSDCFYVSAERVRDEFLLAKPVGVLGNQGANVIARSYEMRPFGVSVGMPIWEAVEVCPQGLYLKRDFRWYEVLSRLMLEVVRELSPHVEYYSIDEFFFEAVPLRGQHYQDTAEEIRERIWRAVRVPVTVGIARTRTLAKLISDSAKPFGAKAVLDPEGEAELLTGRPVTEITGIAARRSARLAVHGIFICLDFARADRRLIRAVLTVAGESLWWEWNGHPVIRLQPDRPLHKMLSRAGSLGEPTAGPDPPLYSSEILTSEPVSELVGSVQKTGSSAPPAWPNHVSVSIILRPPRSGGLFSVGGDRHLRGISSNVA